MNPEANKFEKLFDKDDLEQLKRHNTELEQAILQRTLVRPNGEPVPRHWMILTEGEHVAVKDYTFKVVHIGESYLVLEPVGLVEIGKK